MKSVYIIFCIIKFTNKIIINKKVTGDQGRQTSDYNKTRGSQVTAQRLYILFIKLYSSIIQILKKMGLEFQ